MYVDDFNDWKHDYRNVLKSANFDSAEAEWATTPVIAIDTWRWQDRDYVTLMAYVRGVCYGGVRVPMPKEEWR